MSGRGYRPFDWDADSAERLETVLQRVRHLSRARIAVVVGFDLDGCVFDTRPRQVHIFREIASLHGWEALCRVQAEHFVDWSLRGTMLNAGIEAAWIDKNEDSVQEQWNARFFHSDYQVHDHAMPGAAAFVREIRAAGAQIVYLTGRDHSMRAGTELALRRFGFPYDAAGVTLVTKPSPELDDTAFKEAALEQIAEMGRVAAYFDNEPANVNVFREHHPDAMVVFLDTDHSPRPIVPDPGIPWIRSFLRS